MAGGPLLGRWLPPCARARWPATPTAAPARGEVSLGGAIALKRMSRASKLIAAVIATVSIPGSSNRRCQPFAASARQPFVLKLLLLVFKLLLPPLPRNVEKIVEDFTPEKSYDHRKKEHSHEISEIFHTDATSRLASICRSLFLHKPSVDSRSPATPTVVLPLRRPDICNQPS